MDSIHQDDKGNFEYHYILLEYICEYISGQIRASSDATDARWVPLNDLDQVPIMPKTKRFIQEILGTRSLVKV
jgi:hypothetical protein